MTLGEKQRAFTLCVGKLIEFAYSQGYELTLGDAYRDPRLAALNAQQGIGIAKSLHCYRLAIDFNLFKDGVFLPDSVAHTPIGVYWKTLHPLARWGGDFKKPDGGHYSFEHEGRK